MKSSLRFRPSFYALVAAGLAASIIPFGATLTAQATTSAVPAPAGVQGWGIGSDALQADRDVVFGTLPNGMRYAIQRHQTPKGDVAVRFAIKGGAKDETDGQRGAAHFVEHMAFNGSKNIPEGQLVPKLERLGLSFGADTNASTALEYTSYKLDLPNAKPEVLDAAMMMMREIADRLTIAPAAVDRERGILVSEASVRNDANRRRIANVLSTQLPGNRLAAAVTADPEQIKRITAKDLRAFYHAFYRPERATLVIVGDVDPAALQRQIVATFADWQSVGAAGADYRGPVAAMDKPAAGSFIDPAIPEIIMFDRSRSYAPPANTAAEERQKLLETLGGNTLANRFQPIALKPESAVLGAQFQRQDLARNTNSYSLYVIARDGKWRDALAIGEQELRRAQQFGFTADEINEVKSNVLSGLTNAAAQKKGLRPGQIAEQLVTQSLENAVPTSPEFDLGFYKAIEASITAESVTAAFRQAWQGKPSLVHVSAKAAIQDAAAEIISQLEKSAQIAVAAPTETAAKAFAYDSFGTPGKVVADSRVDDLGIRKVRFANGVQLNLKRTDWEPDNVAFAMEVGKGASAFPADKPGLDVMTGALLPQDGLKAHDSTELRRILAGHQVSLILTAGQDALTASGKVAATDLALQLKLLAARLSATGFRVETGAQWAPFAQTIGQAMSAQPLQVWQLSFNNVLSGGDGRLGLPAPSALTSRSFSELQAALVPQLTQGGVALSLVGDIDEDATIATVASTLGALPAREARQRSGFAAPTIGFKASGTTTLTHNGQADQGVISISWPTTDDRDLKDSLTRGLLAQAMSLAALDLVREKLGATYTPQGLSYDQSTYAGFGHITLVAASSPAEMGRIEAAFRKIAADMREKPIGADLLNRAREPVLAGMARSDKQNSGWTAVANTAQSWPERLDRRRQREAILRSISPMDIQAAAKRYLLENKSAAIRVLPAAAAK